MVSRRSFLTSAAGALVSANAVSKTALAQVPEAPLSDTPATQPPNPPQTGRPYQPVVTLNGWSLPWRMRDNVKEFHLVAEPVEREMASGMTAHLWGYNGQSPGPTIECVEGDRVRIFVTNKLPEYTTIHWHGVRVPQGDPCDLRQRSQRTEDVREDRADDLRHFVSLAPVGGRNQG